ncbi:hypothetical protein ABK040_014386 [Willaertia magna]
MPRKGSFDPNDYLLEYDEAMKDSCFREIFHQFLKIGHSEEPILFLNDLENYKNCYNENKKDVNKIFNLANNIIHTYLKEESVKQINLGGNNIVKMLNDWHNIEIETDVDKKIELLHPFKLFEDVSFNVNLDLKLDQLPRFLRSEMYTKFMKEKGEKYVQTIATDISNGYQVDFKYKPKDFTSPILTDKDVYFAYQLFEDTPDWELIYDSFKKNQKLFTQAFISHTNYVFGNSKGFKLTKFVMHFPYSRDEVFKCFSDKKLRMEIDDNLVDLCLEKYFPPNTIIKDQQSSSLGIQVLSVGLNLHMAFLKNRDLPHVTANIYDPNIDCIVSVAHSTNAFEDIIHKERTPCEMLIFYAFHKISENLTRFSHVVYLDLNLPLNSELMLKSIWKRRTKEIQKNFLKVLERESKIGSPKEDSLGYNKSLQANMEAHPNRSWYKEYLNLNKKTF